MKTDDERRSALVEIADDALDFASKYDTSATDRAAALTTFRLAREGLNFVPPRERFPNYTPCPACSAPVEKGTQGHRITGCPSKSRHAWTLAEIGAAFGATGVSAGLDGATAHAAWVDLQSNLPGSELVRSSNYTAVRTEADTVAAFEEATRRQADHAAKK